MKTLNYNQANELFSRTFVVHDYLAEPESMLESDRRKRHVEFYYEDLYSCRLEQRDAKELGMLRDQN